MKRLLVGAAALAIALAGCSSAEPEPTPTPEPTTEAPTPTPTPTPTPEPTPEATACAPFTGLAADDGDPKPLVAVKIENSRPARPQTGLDGADVVFVEMVEGGTTRFNALYNSEFPETVGNIRSLRTTDANILGQWSGEVTLFYSGGMPVQEADVRNAGVTLRVHGTHAGFWRSNTRVAPHNLYLSLEEQAATLEAPEECVEGLFEYLPDGDAAADGATADAASNAADGASSSGEPASTIRANYPRVVSGWDWNADTELWERSDDGAPNVNSPTGDPITAVNVVVLHVTARDTGLKDSSGAPVPETILDGEGDLDYFVNGVHTTGTWSKEGLNEPFVFTDADGDPLLLTPGNTWVELLPNTGSLNYQ